MLCKEFGCLPSAIIGEDGEPLGPLLEIAQLRGYVAARRQVDAATDEDQVEPAVANLVGAVKARRFALERRPDRGTDDGGMTDA